MPTFGLPDSNKRIWCASCPNRPDNSIDLKHKLCQCVCMKIPVYNLPGIYPGIWCFNCSDKPYNAINVMDKLCKQCDDVQVKNKYDGYCVKCFVYLFPDQILAKNYKIRENCILEATIKLVKQMYTSSDSIQIVRDSRINKGSSLRRPDVFFNMYTHWICAENDENSHKNYSDENKRTNELYNDMNKTPMVLIRFNCDSYIINSNKKASLFKIDKTSKLYVIRDQSEFDKRIKTFAECIVKHITKIPEKAITTEFLYYSL